MGCGAGAGVGPWGLLVPPSALFFSLLCPSSRLAVLPALCLSHFCFSLSTLFFSFCVISSLLCLFSYFSLCFCLIFSSFLCICVNLLPAFFLCFVLPAFFSSLLFSSPLFPLFLSLYLYPIFLIMCSVSHYSNIYTCVPHFLFLNLLGPSFHSVNPIFKSGVPDMKPPQTLPSRRSQSS